MATNIMPHNLSEVVDGCVAYIDNREISIAELMNYVKAPDFPTGGTIYGMEGVKAAMHLGRGKVVVRGKMNVDTKPSGREQIIITEVPYQVNRDGSVDITQTIDWTFPDTEERHGIIRTVTVRAGYQDSQTQYRYYSLSNVEVSSPTGAPTDVSISDFGAEKQIRIGSPTRTVSGTQTYLVSFRLEHVVNDIGDGTAEFYYNHVAPSNEYDYRQVTASVTGPAAAKRPMRPVAVRSASGMAATSFSLISRPSPAIAVWMRSAPGEISRNARAARRARSLRVLRRVASDELVAPTDVTKYTWAGCSFSSTQSRTSSTQLPRSSGVRRPDIAVVTCVVHALANSSTISSRISSLEEKW